jgi:hypothetical protein
VKNGLLKVQGLLALSPGWPSSVGSRQGEQSSQIFTKLFILELIKNFDQVPSALQTAVITILTHSMDST